MADRVRFRHLVRAGPDFSSRPFETPDERIFHARPESPPMAVEAQDGEGTLDDIGALLKQKRLFPDDLVDLGRGWETISDTPELGELASKLHRPVRWSPSARVFAAFLAVAIVILVAGAELRRGDVMELGELVLIAGIFAGAIAFRRTRRAKRSVVEHRFDPKAKS